MSVVSERSATGRRSRPRPLGGRGRGYSQSDIGGPTDPLINSRLPQFSAIASEGFKRPSVFDEWGENTTMLTGNTSEHSFCGMEENKGVEMPVGRMVVRRCSRMLWLLFASLVAILSFLSAPAMVLIPVGLHYMRDEWPPIVCELDCQGNLFNLAFCSFFLVAGHTAMYYRRATSDLPRLYFARAALTILVLFELFGFWLFYVVRILLEKETRFIHVTSFALSLVICLLFTLGFSVIVLMLRKHRPEYIITIVRDPDGESRTLMIGQMSIQEASVEVLRFYHAQFPSYNVYLDKAHHSGGRMKGGSMVTPGIKMYDIEGLGGPPPTISASNTRVLMEAMARRRQTSHAELSQREQDWEGRLHKRKYRLLAAAEDAFAQVQPAHHNQGGPKFGGELDLGKAADTVLAWVNKPLNKYLKLTRQQEKNPPEELRNHIKTCLAMKLSHRTFLQRFSSDRFPPKFNVGESKWSLACGWACSAPISNSLLFSLRCHDNLEDVGVQLICTVTSIPFYNIVEQNVGAEPQKFTIRVANDIV